MDTPLSSTSLLNQFTIHPNNYTEPLGLESETVIKDDMSGASSLQIIKELFHRVQLKLENSEDLRKLWTAIILPTLTKRTHVLQDPRATSPTTIYVNNSLGDGTLPISDFYSAMGHILSTTDGILEPVSDERQLKDASTTLLWNFCRWSHRMHTVYFSRGQKLPVTAAVAFMREGPDLPWMSAVGHSESGLIAQLEKFQSNQTIGKDKLYVSNSIPENVRKNAKDHIQAVREAQLLELAESLDVTLPPLFLRQIWIRYGHCAETLILLYLFSRAGLGVRRTQKRPGRHLDVYALAVDMQAVIALKAFKLTDIVAHTSKKACSNCEILMGHAKQVANQLEEPRDYDFIYRNRLSDPNGEAILPAYPELPKCKLESCWKSGSQLTPARLLTTCKGCGVYFYCSDDCALLDVKHECPGASQRLRCCAPGCDKVKARPYMFMCGKPCLQVYCDVGCYEAHQHSGLHSITECPKQYDQFLSKITGVHHSRNPDSLISAGQDNVNHT